MSATWMSDPALGRVAGTGKSSRPIIKGDSWLPITLGFLTAVIFCLSAKAAQEHFDYTYRIADALLHGHLGLFGQPPLWLNEMVGRGGEYYSVFPLGAVLAVTPLAVLRDLGWINRFPGRILAALLAGACVYFFFRLSGIENNSLGRRILYALFPVFGTWTWCNLGFAGAWQIALGFALLGETAALYFTLVKPRPILAGIFFALAFGNRTELILTLPIFLCFWIFPRSESVSFQTRRIAAQFRRHWKSSTNFLVAPAVLALGTALYNLARFHSPFDFGYAHIPNLIQEPWYQHGLFSVHAIRWNAYKMLFEGMEDIPHFPFLRPHPFGCSVFLASPFLFLLFREGGKDKALLWSAIAGLTLALWCHGNPGGWQFSYRYGIILLPWMFLLLVGNGPRKVSASELSLFLASIAINALATYQFLWTNDIKP